MAVGMGTDQIMAIATTWGPTPYYSGRRVLGRATIVDAGRLLLLTSVGAGMMSYHNTVSR